MHSNQYLHFNGKILSADKLLISPNNRSFRYGDGFFETIKMINGKIILEDYHFERLFTSLELLQFEKPHYFTADYLRTHIEELAKKNYHSKLARVRLMIFRGDGGLYDPENHFPNHLIQTWELNPSNNILNENGLVIDIFKDAKKACDNYSHVKSNNYLSYAMAALWAKKQHLNDALLLNSYNRIADTTIGNIFIVKDGVVKTPALNEGCVSGVMRRHLLKCMREENMPVEETAIEADELLQASEVFLSNGIYGIKWVRSCGNSNYTQQLSALLHKKFVTTLL
jgi:branched-subunit amino acid aminotransferase/4-amino-4-deoxychorismate lyase